MPDVSAIPSELEPFAHLLAKVEPHDLRWFLAEGERMKFKADDVLLQEHGNTAWFFFLLRGSAKVYMTSGAGVTSVVKLFSAPACFGETECLTGNPLLVTISALEPSEALRFPASTFLHLVQASPAFTQAMLRDVAARFYVAQQNSKAQAFDPVEPRLARIIRDYLDVHGLPVEDGTMIRVPLSQESLANSIGVGRRSVTRTLSKWEELGMLRKQGRMFVVRDRAELERLCESESIRVSYNMR